MNESAPNLQTERLRYEDAAHYLGVPVTTLRSMVCRRQIPHYRIGARLVLFTRADLDAWLAAHRVEAGDTAPHTP